MHFDVSCHLFWMNTCVMCWNIDELERTCDQLDIFAHAVGLSAKFAFLFLGKQSATSQMIHEPEIDTTN